MQVLRQLPIVKDPRILVGDEKMDDAGVFRIDDRTALVQSVDVLTPIADEPYVFGEIAAANALSDLYAMGAQPITALSVLCYNPDKLENRVVGRILEGVAAKVHEAGAFIIGGHTIKDVEVKCGLAVTGLVAPDRIVTIDRAKPGDVLILTKPIGTGVISTALMSGSASARAVETINNSMRQLNAVACDAMLAGNVPSATDVTGFGLLGHALEMAQASDVSFVIGADAVPLFEDALEYARKGLYPGGTIKNSAYVEPHVVFNKRLPKERKMLLCDAQTSGGLLIAAPKDSGAAMVQRMTESGVAACTIGNVIEKKDKSIYVE
jgi:selenide,water dikinase